MKPQDLRIGNWVNCITCDGTKQEGIVNEITEIHTRANGWTYLEPIPLTEEWLLRFGFEEKIMKTKIIWEYTRHITMKLIKGYKRNGYPFHLLGYKHNPHPIKHVHQLQNLYFALTGEELTIK